jgi:hypothetical protein
VKPIQPPRMSRKARQEFKKKYSPYKRNMNLTNAGEMSTVIIVSSLICIGEPFVFSLE